MLKPAITSLLAERDLSTYTQIVLLSPCTNSVYTTTSIGMGLHHVGGDPTSSS